MSKHVVVFIDTENISPDGNTGIISLTDYRDYKSVGVFCYGLEDEKSQSSVEWKKIATSTDGYEWKSVSGPRKKNAVDIAMKNGIKKLLDWSRSDELDVWVIASSDGGFVPIINQIKSKGHRVIVAYKSIVSDKLELVADEMYHL